MNILIVCTANQCRSPMAEQLLRQRLAERGVADVVVSSAGLLAGGVPATADAQSAVPGLEAHTSRQLTPGLVAGADVVIAMARMHVREASILDNGALARTFTLKELVRRGENVGPRRTAEPVAAWLARAAADRQPRDLLGDSDDDDVADPIGGPASGYVATAGELDELLLRLTSLLWP